MIDISPGAERAARAAGLAYGYPVHRVPDDAVSERDTDNGLHLTDWTAACGVSGQEVGRRYGRDDQPRGSALQARRLELCRQCWPSESRGR